jgi:hypothetical protein
MVCRRLTRVFVLVLSTVGTGCARDEKAPPLAPPSFSLEGDPTVTSLVFGPNGSSICDVLAPGAEVQGRLINPTPPPNFVGQDGFACPDNTLAMGGPPGAWLMRVQLPADPAIGLLPWRHLETDPVVFGEDTRRDVQILSGTTLGGSATLDGAPLEGVALDVVYNQAPAFGATSGASGADGTWTEFFRAPMILQNNVRYQVPGGCGALGALTREGSPSEGFLFPTEVSAINCKLQTAPSAQFSHTHTRLVVTPMPGDVGGQSVELADRYGIGWGVQFPVEPAQAPVHVPVSATHLFGGGLLIGIAPDRILSGFSLAGQLDCGAACRDLGLDGKAAFTSSTPHGRQVIWRYSDAGSSEGVGLRVVQRSFDGQPPNDYVLFRFSIQNGGSSAVTFYTGFFADWDVEEDASDDFGFTDLDGRLMAVTSATESGIHVGSLLLGAPVSGNFFYNLTAETPPPFSPAEQYQALSGAIRRPEIGNADTHYIHGVGPITLKRKQQRDVWLAIVAGESRAQLLANAVAARRDVARRLDDDAVVDEAHDDGPAGATGTASGPAGATASAVHTSMSRPVFKGRQPH